MFIIFDAQGEDCRAVRAARHGSGGWGLGEHHRLCRRGDAAPPPPRGAARLRALSERLSRPASLLQRSRVPGRHPGGKGRAAPGELLLDAGAERPRRGSSGALLAWLQGGRGLHECWSLVHCVKIRCLRLETLALRRISHSFSRELCAGHPALHDRSGAEAAPKPRAPPRTLTQGWLPGQ